MSPPAATGRRQARRTALFLLYQWDLTGQPLTALYEGVPDAFALVESGQRLSGQVPLVEEEERRAARLPPAGAHASSSTNNTSTAVTDRPAASRSTPATRA